MYQPFMINRVNLEGEIPDSCVPLFCRKAEQSTVKTNCFGFEGKTREERNLFIFKDIPRNNQIY